MTRTTILDQAMAEYRAQQGDRRDVPSPADVTERAASTTVGGATFTVDSGETVQSLDDSFLTGSDQYGAPRGREALQARHIAETAPMQVIGNAIVDQLLGGDLALPSEDEESDDRVADLKAVMLDILEGPHLQGDDFDDLVAAAVWDMIGPGNAYWEPLAPAQDGVELPFVALKPVDPLTVRHNITDTGAPADPPYYQSPFQTVGGSFVSIEASSPAKLQQDDLVVMRYPGSKRSNRVYPMSPAMQVQEWLELLDNSTTHHGRYYSDNELPPGLLTAREATQQDVDSIRDELEAAKGDPRSAPVVGTDARWVEVGGSAVDLSVVEEQQWFIQLCAAAFGIPKTELGLVEDVNRNTSETQLTTVHKRVTQPLAKTIGQAITRQLLPLFDVYQALGQPFEAVLRYSDPLQERAHEEHLRERYVAGAMTYREYREAVGDDMSDVDTTVVIGGEEIDYGAYPKPVVDALLRDARSEPSPDADVQDE